MRRSLLLILIVFLISCKRDLEKVQQFALKSDFATESVTGVQIVYTDSGALKAKVEAKLLQHFPYSKEPYMLIPKGLYATFYDLNQEPNAMVSAGSGIYYEAKKEMHLKENVMLVNTKGDTLKTEYLIWDEANEKIRTDHFVKIITPDEVIFGDGFESNQNFTEYRIRKIRGTLKLNPDGQKVDSL